MITDRKGFERTIIKLVWNSEPKLLKMLKISVKFNQIKEKLVTFRLLKNNIFLLLSCHPGLFNPSESPATPSSLTTHIHPLLFELSLLLHSLYVVVYSFFCTLSYFCIHFILT